MTDAYETLFIALAALASAGLILPRAWRAPLFASGKLAARVCLAAAMAMLLLHGYTWRSLPAILAAFLFSSFFLVRARRAGAAGSASPHAVAGAYRNGAPESATGRIWRIGAGTAGLALSLAGLALMAAFPVAKLEAPNGPSAVGTSSFMLSDPARTGIYGDEPGQARRIMVQAWYPAAAPAKAWPRAYWLPDPAVRAAMADYARIPAFMLSHLTRARVNAYANALPVEDQPRLPVVVLSHGWSGTRFLHADLAEELASRGMLVLAVDHSYGALAVTLPGGQTVPWYPRALPKREADPEFLTKARYLVGVYADDVSLVVDTVRGGRLPERLAAVADGGRIALAGHSTGGGADALVTMRDPGILGMVGLDAWVEPLGAELDAGTRAAQLHLGSQAWNDDLNEPWLKRLEAASGPWAMYRVAGTGHEDFAMTLQVTPLARLLGLSRGIGKDRFRQAAVRTAADWLAALFARGPESAYAGLPADGSVPELSRD